MQDEIDLEYYVSAISDPIFGIFFAIEDDEPVERIGGDLDSVQEALDKYGKVFLEIGYFSYDGTYETSLMGINSVRNIERMLVDATLKNIEVALGYEDTFILEDVRTIPVSSEKAVVVVVMCMVEDMEQKLCGSCLVKTDYKEAIVKATLDAVNRYTTK